MAFVRSKALDMLCQGDLRCAAFLLCFWHSGCQSRDQPCTKQQGAFSGSVAAEMCMPC